MPYMITDGVMKKIKLRCPYKSYDGKQSTSEDSSSESESETFVLPLFESIEKGEELAVIQKYLTEDQIKARDNLKNSCLHIAVSIFPYNLNVIKELLKNGAKTNPRNWKKNTPLHSAAENSNCGVDLILVLLEYKANPNARNKLGDTPLHLFVAKCLREPKNHENFEIIKLLLKNGASPSVRNSVNLTPFIFAVHPPYCLFGTYVGLVKYDTDLSKTRSNESLLTKPTLNKSSRSVDVIKLLLQYEPSLIKSRDKKGCTPLHIAVANGASVDIVLELIRKGADVNAQDAKGDTPLHRTASASYSVIETLVKYGAKVNTMNKYNYFPLCEAINHRLRQNSVTDIRALIELGAGMDFSEFSPVSPLTDALYNDSIPHDVIRLLLEKLAHTCKNHFSYPIYTSCSSLKSLVFSNNKDVAKICIQFILLNLFVTKKWNKINTLSELIIAFIKNGNLADYLIKFQYHCLIEIFHMTRDKLDENVFLFSYVWQNIFVQDNYIKYPISFFKDVIYRIHSRKYPRCAHLLHSCIKRNVLIDFLSLLVIYTFGLDDFKKKHIIILDVYSILNLAQFLDKNTLLNLVLVFSRGMCFIDYKEENKNLLTYIITHSKRKKKSTLPVTHSKRTKHE